MKSRVVVNHLAKRMNECLRLEAVREAAAYGLCRKHSGQLTLMWWRSRGMRVGGAL